MVGPTMFQGPCKAPVRFQVQGNVLAPVDLNVFKSQSTWISFQNVDRLTVSGGGSFDGQGTPAMWSKNDCAKNWKCTLPIVCANAIVSSITDLVPCACALILIISPLKLQLKLSFSVFT